MKWKHSGLFPGQKVRASGIFVDSDKNLLKTEYISETDAGILVESYFTPPFFTENKSMWHYRRFINWGQIFTGQVQIKTASGDIVRTIPIKNMEVFG